MEKLKIMIIIVVILIFIVLGLLVITKNEPAKNQANVSNENNIIEEDISVNETTSNEISEEYPNRDKVDIESQEVAIVKNRTDFFTVESIVNQYLNALCLKEDNRLMNMLDKNFKENSIDSIKVYESMHLFVAEKIFYRVDNNISTYFVYGTIEEQVMDEYMPKNEFNITVIVDYNTGAFSIIPYEIENINSYKYEGGTIEVNDDNTNNTDIMVTDEAMSNIYLKHYRENAMRNVEKAYDSLNEEYRNKRFGNIDKYKEYLDNKFYNMSIVKLDKYLVKEREEYNEYTLIDTYGNYYIFQESSPMQYTVILDIYTIDIPEFLEKYNNANKETKVRMNINRFFEAIGEENYKYAYEKLEDSYKQNNFPIIEDFEKYAKTIFKHDDEIEIVDFSSSGENYVCTIQSKNNENIIQKNITIRLLEGTDYRISIEIL